jgi:hypothetical protein
VVATTGATSVTLNFLGKLSDEDIVLQHPGAMTTILVLVGRYCLTSRLNDRRPRPQHPCDPGLEKLMLFFHVPRLSSHFIMPNTRHAAIKTLHDIFLQNDPVKDQFISNHLIGTLHRLHLDAFVSYRIRVDAHNTRDTRHTT